ncbi:hypothetical protein CTAM01_10202 [Colletotrichum tamarilloi]|uniref:Uncharacterized protein n=1 Tax=Colletotrichum tamarilloi TaxID=1209934 RepID=A0ABQ9R143_9PEZI|nr:uncharacterized protein CTAM01_10202 [Colletotrichum tamarilloi]KAK1491879.1 hypothetical protein CTAM01_10202 [Colletotrichum tamarilloi]
MDRSQSYRPDKPPGCRRVKRPPVGFASPHPVFPPLTSNCRASTEITQRFQQNA